MKNNNQCSGSCHIISCTGRKSTSYSVRRFKDSDFSQVEREVSRFYMVFTMYPSQMNDHPRFEFGGVDRFKGSKI